MYIVQQGVHVGKWAPALNVMVGGIKMMGEIPGKSPPHGTCMHVHIAEYIQCTHMNVVMTAMNSFMVNSHKDQHYCEKGGEECVEPTTTKVYIWMARNEMMLCNTGT